MYGEGDERFFPTILKFADKWNGHIPRIAEGGKKQMTYVGEYSPTLLKLISRYLKRFIYEFMKLSRCLK
jgi:hypothetical protein